MRKPYKCCLVPAGYLLIFFVFLSCVRDPFPAVTRLRGRGGASSSKCSSLHGPIKGAVRSSSETSDLFTLQATEGHTGIPNVERRCDEISHR